MEIPNFQAAIGTDGALGATRICGAFFNSATGNAAHQTLCSFATPFRVGVRFDADETTGANTDNAHGFIENETSISGSGFGFYSDGNDILTALVASISLSGCVPNLPFVECV